MSPHAEIADALAGMRAATGGNPSQRAAAAHFVLGAFHLEFASLARELKRRDFVADVYDNATSVTLKMESAFVQVTRWANGSEMKIEFVGFSPDVLPFDSTRQAFTPAWESTGALEALVQKTVQGIGLVLQAEQARRQGTSI